jgi:L-alanine-DL-glutamate epimerase-like enolase superfamily enzyme
MKIADIKCAVIASSPVIRITTDEGFTGWSQIETPKPYLQPIVLQLKSWLVGQDPLNVERVMRRIRVRGGFKPWGAAVSAIEIALWHIAGQRPACQSIACLAARCATKCAPTARSIMTPVSSTALRIMTAGPRSVASTRSGQRAGRPRRVRGGAIVGHGAAA